MRGSESTWEAESELAGLRCQNLLGGRACVDCPGAHAGANSLQETMKMLLHTTILFIPMVIGCNI